MPLTDTDPALAGHIAASQEAGGRVRGHLAIALDVAKQRAQREAQLPDLVDAIGDELSDVVAEIADLISALDKRSALITGVLASGAV